MNFSVTHFELIEKKLGSSNYNAYVYRSTGITTNLRETSTNSNVTGAWSTRGGGVGTKISVTGEITNLWHKRNFLIPNLQPLPVVEQGISLFVLSEKIDQITKLSDGIISK